MTSPDKKEEQVSEALVTDETAPWQEIYDRLNQQADQENPPGWQPENEGEELFGQVIKVNEAAPTKFGSAPVVTIRKPSDELVSLWLLHTVLRREFIRAKPSLGEWVLVRYTGRVQPDGGGSAYETYTVVLDRKEGALDWGSIGEMYGDNMTSEPPSTTQTDAPLPAGTPEADDDIPFMPSGGIGF